MELKVWVDGIQRIVCGVSDATTCQDVVYALAHATSQTGRFTLIEKWRSNEKILSPSDKPVKVLLKWGEYSGDVQFVLRRSSSANKSLQSDDLSKPSYFSPQRLPSDSREGSKSPSSSGKEIKKSLTFSGGRSGASTPSDLLATPPAPNNRIDVSSVQGNRSDPPLYKDHRSRHDLPKGVVRGVPQQKPFYNGNDTIANDKGCDPVIIRSNKKIGPPPEYRIPPPCKPFSPNQKLSPDRSPHRKTPSDDNIRKTLVNNSSHSVLPPPPPVSIEIPVIRSPTTSPRENRLKKDITYHPKETVHESKVPVSLNSSGRQVPVPPERTEASHEKFIKRSQQNDPQYYDLLRTVGMQRDKISTLDWEIKQYDSEIKYWEDTNRKHEHQAQIIEREIKRLQFSEKEQSEHISKLDFQQFDNEYEKEIQNEQTLKNELSRLRLDLKSNEKEVLKLNASLQKLSTSVKEEKDLLNKEKKGTEDHEKEMMDQIEFLKQDIELEISKCDKVLQSCESTEQELADVDHKLSIKKKEADDLVIDMKAVNLESLTLGSSDDSKSDGFTQSRSGSTRKMVGSPRELENAVPTNKNPHGVWV